MDIAEIGIRAETGTLEVAERNVDSFTKKVVAGGQKAEAAMENLGEEFKETARETKTASQAISAAGSTMGGIRAGANRAAGSLDDFGRSANAARFNTANLAAQGNDVIVMALAMQNPLQLALQQGTQVSQVLNQMGGRADIVRGLGAAFTSMINPVSLATIGILAGGTALAQWGISALRAGENTERLKDAMDDLKSETEDARNEIELFNRGLDNTSQLTVLNAIAAKEQEIAERRERLENATGRSARGAQLRLDQAIRERDNLQQQLDIRNATVDAEQRLQRIRDQAQDAGAAYFERLRAEEQANVEAEKLLATMLEQNTVQAAINKYGEDSAEVTALRAANEREAFNTLLDSMNVSQELKDKLTGAFLVGQDLANTDISRNISIAADEAGRLARNIAAAQLEGVTGPDGAVQQVRGSREDAIVFQRTFRARATSGGSRGGSRSSGGGSSGASQAQRDAERLRNEQLREAERIMRSLRGPQADYIENVAQANRLHAAGVLPLDALTQHLNQLQLEFNADQWESSGLQTLSDDFANAIASAESLGDATNNLRDLFINNIRRMAAESISSGFASLFQGAFGFAGGGVSQGAAGIISNIVNAIPGRATGGPVTGGSPYIIGERGPELFVPNTSGTVVPNNQMGGQVTVRVIGGDLMLSDNGRIMSRVQVVAEQASQGALAQVPTVVREYTEIYG